MLHIYERAAGEQPEPMLKQPWARATG